MEPKIFRDTIDKIDSLTKTIVEGLMHFEKNRDIVLFCVPKDRNFALYRKMLKESLDRNLIDLSSRSVMIRDNIDNISRDFHTIVIPAGYHKDEKEEQKFIDKLKKKQLTVERIIYVTPPIPPEENEEKLVV